MWQDDPDFTRPFIFANKLKKTYIRQDILHFHKALTHTTKNIKAPETSSRGRSLADHHVIADIKVSGDLIPCWIVTSFHSKSDG